MNAMDRIKQRARADAANMSRAELLAKEQQLDRLIDDLDLGLYSFDAQSIQDLSRSTAKPRLGLCPVRATSLVSPDQAEELRSTARQVQYQRLWLQRQRDQGKTTLADVPHLPEFKQLKGWIVDLATAHLYNSRGIESRATKRCTLGTHGYIKVADTVLQRVVMASWINAVDPDLLPMFDEYQVHHVNPNAKKTLAGNTLDKLVLVDKADHAKLSGAQRALTQYFDRLYQPE